MQLKNCLIYLKNQGYSSITFDFYSYFSDYFQFDYVVHLIKDTSINTYKWNDLEGLNNFTAFKEFLEPILKSSKELFESAYKGKFVFNLLNLPFTVTQHLTVLNYISPKNKHDFTIDANSSIYSIALSLKEKGLEELIFRYLYDTGNHEFTETSFTWASNAQDRGTSVLSSNNEESLIDYAISKLFGLSHALHNDLSLQASGTVTFNFVNMILSLTEDYYCPEEKSFVYVIPR